MLPDAWYTLMIYLLFSPFFLNSGFLFYDWESVVWRLGHLTGHPRCKELTGCFCLELIRAVNQFCWSFNVSRAVRTSVAWYFWRMLHLVGSRPIKGENGKTLDLFCQRFVRDCWTRLCVKILFKRTLGLWRGERCEQRSPTRMHVCIFWKFGVLNYTITLS